MYIPEGEDFRLIYKAQIDSLAPYGDWEHRIDARTGEIISVRDIAIRRKVRKPAIEFGKYEGPIFSRTETTDRFLERRAQQKQQ